jgi:hypothetical protein
LNVTRTALSFILTAAKIIVKNPAGVNRLACSASFIADKLFGPPAPFASESDEVRLGFPDLARSYHHERAAVQARRILPRVQRIEQEFLVAGHKRPLTEA